MLRLRSISAFIVFVFGVAFQHEANAQSCSATGVHNFFTFCSPGASLVYNGDYTIDIGQNESVTINGNLTINGLLTINFTGNTSLLRIESPYELLAANVEINNSNPAKVLDIDGTFTVTGTLDFNGENIDMDGTGSLSAGAIAGAGNVTCASEGDCPTVSGGSCSPSSGLCTEGCPTNCTLPIQLISFGSLTTVSSVKLLWATATEKNFDYFSLQRSTDGLNFGEIAQIKGFGTTTERRDYSYEDRFPVLGRSYYRLTSVDYDGYTETFDVISVNYGGEKSARVFPNPAVEGKINIELSFTPTEVVDVVLTDLSGMEKGRHQSAGQTASFNAELNPGTYIVKISSGDFSKVMRVVVR